MKLQIEIREKRFYYQTTQKKLKIKQTWELQIYNMIIISNQPKTWKIEMTFELQVINWSKAKHIIW